jgi:hypothetical protein
VGGRVDARGGAEAERREGPYGCGSRAEGELGVGELAIGGARETDGARSVGTLTGGSRAAAEDEGAIAGSEMVRTNMAPLMPPATRAASSAVTSQGIVTDARGCALDSTPSFIGARTR